MKNPFGKIFPYPRVEYVEALTVEDRCDMVKAFSVEQLREVIALPGVQKTVLVAVNRQLKKLLKEAK